MENMTSILSLFLPTSIAFLFISSSSYSVRATNVGNQFKWRIEAGTKATVSCRVDYAMACTFFIDDPNGISENTNCSPIETQAYLLRRDSLLEPDEDKGNIYFSTTYNNSQINQMNGELCCAGTPIIAVTSANDEHVDTCFDGVRFYLSEDDVSDCSCKLEDGTDCIPSAMEAVYNTFDSLEDLMENSSCAPSQSPTISSMPTVNSSASLFFASSCSTIFVGVVTFLIML